MKRRDLLKHATLVVAGAATSALSIEGEASTGNERSQSHPIGKIALEEHFLIPDFVGYFAETYPNISPAIRDFGTGVLQDLGDKRIEVMDKNHIDYVVLSIAGPGVQFEKDASVAKRKARMANDFLAAEINKRPARYGGFAHLAMQDPAEAANDSSAVCTSLVFMAP